MKKSPLIGSGIYQFEFRQDRIDLVEWNQPPTSTDQWIRIEVPFGRQCYLEGSCNEDIRVVEADTEIEFFTTSG